MDKTSPRAYTIDGLSEAQLQVICSALELASRIGMGQIEYLMEEVRMGAVTDSQGHPVSFEALESGDQLIMDLKKKLTGYGQGASKGIGNEHTPVRAKIAYEVQKAIRHHLAWERNPEGGHGVAFDDPYLIKYTNEPKLSIMAYQDW